MVIFTQWNENQFYTIIGTNWSFVRNFLHFYSISTVEVRTGKVSTMLFYKELKLSKFVILRGVRIAILMIFKWQVCRRITIKCKMKFFLQVLLPGNVPLLGHSQIFIFSEDTHQWSYYIFKTLNLNAHATYTWHAQIYFICDDVVKFLL